MVESEEQTLTTETSFPQLCDPHRGDPALLLSGLRFSWVLLDECMIASFSFFNHLTLPYSGDIFYPIVGLFRPVFFEAKMKAKIF